MSQRNNATRGRLAASLTEDPFADATQLSAEIITVEIASLNDSVCGIEVTIGVGPEFSISSVRSQSPIVDGI